MLTIASGWALALEGMVTLTRTNHGTKAILFLSALLGLLTVALIVVRAARQEITVDEAYTFLNFVDLWRPDSNNHVLNSLLMRTSVGAFGVSELTLRLPSVTAGIVYTAVSISLATMLLGRRLASLMLAAALILSPLVFDFLVAARCYGL